MILILKVLEKIFDDYKSMSESDCWWLSIMTDHSKTGTISTFVNLLLINKKKVLLRQRKIENILMKIRFT